MQDIHSSEEISAINDEPKKESLVQQKIIEIKEKEYCEYPPM